MRHDMTGNTRVCWGRRLAVGRLRPTLLALLLPLTALGWATVRPTLRLPTALSVTSDGTWGPVATVAEVEHGLVQDPADWSGRIVLR